jgi:hypothetical protein
VLPLENFEFGKSEIVRINRAAKCDVKSIAAALSTNARSCRSRHPPDLDGRPLPLPVFHNDRPWPLGGLRHLRLRGDRVRMRHQQLPPEGHNANCPPQRDAILALFEMQRNVIAEMERLEAVIPVHHPRKEEEIGERSCNVGDDQDGRADRKAEQYEEFGGFLNNIDKLRARAELHNFRLCYMELQERGKRGESGCRNSIAWSDSRNKKGIL